MSKGELALESIRTTYRKKIWSKFIKAVKDFANKYENMEEIIFVLFSDEDFDIYQEKLRG